MHELGMLRSVVAAVERATADETTGVEAVGLRVGTRSGVVPDALHGAWPIAIADTTLRGARLEIETVPAAVWCPGCAATQPVDEFYALLCPVCATPTANLVTGREFAVAYVDLLDPDHDGPASTSQ